MTQKSSIRHGLDIAIIGMTGRFPGAANIEEFWENLKNGTNTITFFSMEEALAGSIDAAMVQLPQFVRARGVLKDTDQFDAAFFGYSPREAEKMDPQMRVYHQCVWHALEDAGYTPGSTDGSIGLYGGGRNNIFFEIIAQLSKADQSGSTMSTTQLSDKDHINTRISHSLNLTGPSFILETQCSTSLVAVHLACQGLLGGECDMALAGGIAITFPPQFGYLYQEGLIHSPDGICRAFDAGANGTLFSDGAGIVVLKRVEDALADNDHIYALIKGSAINNDGSRKVGYTAPSVEGQMEVIRTSLQLAQVDREDISYVEAHGTGTSLGDPIEIEALKLAFNTEKKGYCRIGSVKTNIGHLDDAAGIAGLIKTVLAMNHKQIPPSLNFSTPNARIDFENSPFRVNTECIPWQSDGTPLRAGVSSFGVGGTNAHVILEEFCPAEDQVVSPGTPFQLMVLSARTEKSLDLATGALARHLKKHPTVDPVDAAYTLQIGRDAFRWRRMLVCSSADEAAGLLSDPGSGNILSFDTRDKTRPVVLLCSPLQGEVPGLPDRIAALCAAEPLLNDELQNLKHPDSASQYVQYVQSVQSALVKLLQAWGIKPVLIVQQGEGELEALSPWLEKENILFVETGPGQPLCRTLGQKYPLKPGQQFLHLLEDGDDCQPAHRFLLDRLGRLWLYGAEVDWKGVYAARNETHRRIPLPGYCFDTQSYKILEDLSALTTQGLISPSIMKTDVADWFYIPSWERTYVRPVQEQGEGTWLLFADTHGIASALRERLALLPGHPRVIMVEQGTTFQQADTHRFVLRPGEPGDYGLLFKHLKNTGTVPTHILHLWTVTPDGEEGDSRQDIFEENRRMQHLGFYSLLEIVRSLGKENMTSDIRLEVISSGIHAVTGEERIIPSAAAMLGAVRVIPREYPNIKCRSIDLYFPGTGIIGPDKDKAAGFLLAEVTGDAGGLTVAYRGAFRWVQVLKPCPLVKPVTKSRFKQGGVYLITGGLGGIGMEIARYLAAEFKTALVLLSRTPLPDRDQWLQHPVGQRVLELENRGAQVMTAAADVSFMQPMEEVMNTIKERFGRLDGIIHAAGVIDYAGVIQRRTRQQSEAVMAPKVTGTLVLDRVVRQAGLEPELFVFCSSTSALSGPFGEAAYTAANAFLDAFAFYLNMQSGSASSGKAVSINWGPWQEVGMAVKALEQSTARGNRDHGQLKGGISIINGLDAMNRILDSGFTQVAVAPVDLTISLQPDEPVQEDKSVRPLQPRPELSTPYVAPRTSLEKSITGIIKDFLAMEEVGLHDNFFDLGISSMDLVQVSGKLKQVTERDVSVVNLFTYPTVEGVARFIEELGESGTEADSGAIEPVEEKEYYPVSPAQKRLFIIQQMDETATLYNELFEFPLEGQYEREAIEKILRQLIDRHESLRTSFRLVDDEPVQQVRPSGDVPFELEYCEKKGSEPRLIAGEADIVDFVRPFDLSRAPLMRSRLVKKDQGGYLLMVDVHHIVADGVSTRIFLEDLIILNRDGTPAPITVRYRDYSQWLNLPRQKELMQQQEHYWLNVYENLPQALNLPLDGNRTGNRGRLGYVAVPLGEDVTANLTAIARQEDATMFMMLLALYYVFLHKISGQEDIVVGTLVSGRNFHGLEQVIGMFVNTLALRNFPGESVTFRQFLGQVKEQTMEAFKNQDYPFDHLVDRAAGKRQLHRNPLFDTTYSYSSAQDSIPVPWEVDGDEEHATAGVSGEQAKFDLILGIKDRKSQLQMTLAYDTALFEKETVIRFSGYFLEIGAQIKDDTDIRLGHISVTHDLAEADKSLIEEQEGDFGF
jgi:acyl transferase domain-containing protein/acyl carrier protein